MEFWRVFLSIIFIHLCVQLTGAGKIINVKNYRRLTLNNPSSKVHRVGNTYIFPKYRSNKKRVQNCYVENSERECCPGWTNNGDGTCSPICTEGCVNGVCIGPDLCRCDQGYRGKSCNQDMNECGWKPRPCDQRCTNTMGSYKCYCERGYVLLEDGTTCVSDSRCFPGKCTHGCELFRNDVRCTCPDGLRANGKFCDDIDECAEGLIRCPKDQVCHNTFGSYTCLCKPGFSFLRVDGKFQCGPTSCREYGLECHEHARCDVTPIGVDCICNEGYFGDGVLCLPYDIEDCSDRPCYPGVSCTNNHEDVDEVSGYPEEGIFKQYICGACPDGYEGDGIDCEDIDECTEGTHNCPQGAECVNTPGSHQCRCSEGFFGNGEKCILLSNETCEDEPCAVGVECVDQPLPTIQEFLSMNLEVGDVLSLVKCLDCPSGFVGNGVTCDDIDECEDGTADCPEGAECINEPGSYSCRCLEGFHGNGEVCVPVSEITCTDNPCFGECIDVPLPDPTNVAYLSTLDIIVLYECPPCPAGFRGDGKNCEDINECEEGTADCPEGAECINEPGSYSCRCIDGFHGNGEICVPVSEETCADNPCFSDCINLDLPDPDDVEYLKTIEIIVQYECSPCPAGYVGDGKVCEDANECEDGTASCPEGARCVNEEGDYRCECLEGYYGDGNICILVMNITCDIIPCFEGVNCTTLPLPSLDDLANVDDVIILFECGPCPPGYTGNGITCDDINECINGTADCPFGSECINDPGTYHCECLGNYFGDGDICVEVSDLTCADSPCFAGVECTDVPLPSMDDLPFLDDLIFLFECGPCPPGYIGDGLVCDDVNECEADRDNCDMNAQCENNDGSFACMCSSGFHGNGTHCAKLDPRSCDENPCFPGVECTDLDLNDLNFLLDIIRLHECGECPEGFIGDGHNCTLEPQPLSQYLNLTVIVHQRQFSEVNPLIPFAVVNAYKVDPNGKNGTSSYTNQVETGLDGIAYVECPHNETILVTAKATDRFINSATFRCNFGQTNVVMIPLHTPYEDTTYLYRPTTERNFGIGNETLGTRYEISFVARSFRVRELTRIRLLFRAVNTSNPDELELAPEMIGALTIEGRGDAGTAIDEVQLHAIEALGAMELTINIANTLRVPRLSKKFEIRFPIFDLPSDLNIGDKVPAWYFKEDAGVWVKDGDGTLELDSYGNLVWTYMADHLSWWAAGRLKERTSCVQVKTCFDEACLSPARDILLRIAGTDYGYETFRYSDLYGEVCIQFPFGRSVEVLNPCSGVSAIIESTSLPSSCDEGSYEFPRVSDDQLFQPQDECKQITLVIPQDTFTAVCTAPPVEGEGTRIVSNPYLDYYYKYSKAIKYECDGEGLAMIEGDGYSVCDRCGKWLGTPVCSPDYYY